MTAVVLILNNFWRKHVRTVHKEINDKLTGVAERNPVFTTVAERFRPRDTQPPVLLSLGVLIHQPLVYTFVAECFELGKIFLCTSLGYRYHR